MKTTQDYASEYLRNSIPGSDYHFGTAEGFPQSKEEVDKADDKVIDIFMGRCSMEDGDEECLACYAYQVTCEREENAR